MRIAIIADIHHGAQSLTKRGDTAMELCARFVEFVETEKPDLVLDLGDRITDKDRDTDLRLEKEVLDALSGITAPIYHICGNHDRDHLTVAENEEVLGQSLQNEVVDLGDWQLALWRADSKILRTPELRGFSLPEEDLLWLNRTLLAATKPTLVASHVPVSDHSQVGNYYFEQNPQFSTYPQSPRVRTVLSQATVPLACVAGHVHWNTLTQIDGTPHLTQQSLTESFTTQGDPAEAWGMIELADDLHWQVFGKDPFQARVTPTARRWTPTLVPF